MCSTSNILKSMGLPNTSLYLLSSNAIVIAYSADKEILVMQFYSQLLLIDIRKLNCIGQLYLYPSRYIALQVCISSNDTFMAILSQREQLLELWNFQKLIESFPFRILDLFQKNMQCHYYY